VLFRVFVFESSLDIMDFLFIWKGLWFSVVCKCEFLFYSMSVVLLVLW
jgi:hypothetical protein